MTQLLVALVVAPILIVVVVAGIRDPMRVALPVYAALIPFGGLISIGQSRFSSLSSIMGLVLGLGLVFQLVSARRSAVRLYAVVPVWLLLLGVAGATVIWSIRPQTTTNGFLILSSLVLVYAFVALSHVDWAVLRRTQGALLFGGAAAVLYGLYQLLILGGFPGGGAGAAAAGAGPAPDGRFGNDMLGPNNEAIALLLPLAIALSRGVTLPERSKRVFYLLLSALLFFGILMTGSRGGLLAAVATLLVLIAAVPRGRRALVTYAVAGVAVGVVVFLFNPGGVAQRTGETTSSSGRTSIWQVGLAACPQYCLAGSGWGTFPDVYGETQASVPGARVLVGEGGTYQAHNLLLLVAIELGLPGVLLLGAGVVLSIRDGLRLPPNLRGPPLAAMMGTFVGSAFLSNLEFKFFWMALMMVALCRNLADVEEVSTRQAALAAVGGGIAAGGAAASTRLRPGPSTAPGGDQREPYAPAGASLAGGETAGQGTGRPAPDGSGVGSSVPPDGALPLEVEVPHVFLEYTDEAVQQLHDAGFEVVVVEAFRGVSENLVVHQVPAAGTIAARGSTVEISIV